MVAPHMRHTQLCPLRPRPVLEENGLWSGRPRRCRKENCPYAHELSQLQPPAWCKDDSHYHRNRRHPTILTVPEWMEVHIYLGQVFCADVCDELLYYAEGLPRAVLPNWFHLWQWVKADRPPCSEDPFLYTLPWDFGHFHRLRVLEQTLGSPLPSGDPRIRQLDLSLSRRWSEMDLMSFLSSQIRDGHQVTLGPRSDEDDPQDFVPTTTTSYSIRHQRRAAHD